MIIKTEPTDDLVLSFRQDTSPISRSPRPQSRRRRGRFEVLLPTRRQVYGDNLPAFENASSFIDLRNLLKSNTKREEPSIVLRIPYGKIEIKEEEMLSEDVVNHRIADVPAFNVELDPEIRDVTTTRHFTSKTWGGNAQETFPSIRQEMLDRHGLDDFMYLNLYFNPHAPQWPGAPGLFFASSVNPNASEWPTIERVLVRLQTNRWLYVGQYRCTPTLSLTPEEWKSQLPKVKKTWMTKVSTQGWGNDIRAKITLKKRLGRDPTAKEFQDALKSKQKFHATPAEVQRAFDQGHAFLQAWCMKCVGYDEDFQREIAVGNACHQ